jgi:hypothetical protein
MKNHKRQSKKHNYSASEGLEQGIYGSHYQENPFVHESYVSRDELKDHPLTEDNSKEAVVGYPLTDDGDEEFDRSIFDPENNSHELYEELQKKEEEAKQLRSYIKRLDNPNKNLIKEIKDHYFLAKKANDPIAIKNKLDDLLTQKNKKIKQLTKLTRNPEDLTYEFNPVELKVMYNELDDIIPNFKKKYPNIEDLTNEQISDIKKLYEVYVENKEEYTEDEE